MVPIHIGSRCNATCYVLISTSHADFQITSYDAGTRTLGLLISIFYENWQMDTIYIWEVGIEILELNSLCAISYNDSLHMHRIQN